MKARRPFFRTADGAVFFLPSRRRPCLRDERSLLFSGVKTVVFFFPGFPSPVCILKRGSEDQLLTCRVSFFFSRSCPGVIRGQTTFPFLSVFFPPPSRRAVEVVTERAGAVRCVFFPFFWPTARQSVVNSTRRMAFFSVTLFRPASEDSGAVPPPLDHNREYQLAGSSGT